MPLPCREAPASQVHGDVLMDASTPDRVLMERVARADSKAFVWLMQRHLRSMVVLAQRVTRNPADADEIAQEAFTRLWINAPRWDPDGAATVKTWLSRVVVNLCLDRLRRRKPGPLEEASDVRDEGPSGFDHVGTTERGRVLQEALDSLPPRQKIAVVLAYFEEKPRSEVALAMDLSLRAVESLLVRARRQLRQTLASNGLKREDV